MSLFSLVKYEEIKASFTMSYWIWSHIAVSCLFLYNPWHQRHIVGKLVKVQTAVV